MRQTLIRIFFDEPWAMWKVDPETGLPGSGIAILLLVAALVWTLWSKTNRGGRRSWQELRPSLILFGGMLAVVTFAPLPWSSVPVFGYGFMMLIAFLSALKLAQWRAAQIGIDRELIFDIGFWILIGGIIGGRLWFLVQKHETVFAGKQGGEALVAVFNLTQGGLVVYGGMIAGTVAFFAYCYLNPRVREGIGTLNMADVVMPSVFIGMGFGRIGCLFNGCCFGDRCELPWAITFPAGSVPWEVLVYRGLLEETSLATFPLHPSQIYSSINGFLLAWVTVAFFPYRRRPGEVFALGCILYPITRFFIETLRGDELGQFGTELTISQFASIGICAAGIALFAVLARRPAMSATPTVVGNAS